MVDNLLTAIFGPRFATPFKPGESVTRVTVTAPANGIQVTLKDQIVLEAFSSDATVVNAVVRFQDLNANITPMEYAVVPTTNRLATDAFLRLSNGFVHSINITCAIKQGTTYVRAKLRLSGLDSLTFCKGYAGDAADVYWVFGGGAVMQGSLEGPGLEVTANMTSPGSGEDFASVQVPTNAKWRLIVLSCQLVTDSNAADRGVFFNLSETIGVFWNSEGFDVQTSGITRQYNWARDEDFVAAADPQDRYHGRIPDIELSEGDRFIVGSSNNQVGDQFADGDYRVREWIDV